MRPLSVCIDSNHSGDLSDHVLRCLWGEGEKLGAGGCDGHILRPWVKGLFMVYVEDLSCFAVLLGRMERLV